VLNLKNPTQQQGYKMKIILIGASGTIGQAILKKLTNRHEIIPVGHSQGDIRVDIADPKSIENMYNAIGKFDALIATTGKVHFARLHEMTADKYEIGLKNKLMGQVNLVLHGLKNINDHGSFTLTSGILNHEPILSATSSAMVNGALEGFIKAAAIDLPRGIRINLVSPTLLKESVDKIGDKFAGFYPVSADEVAYAYEKSVEGAQTGVVYKVGYA
jgi:NAD(P)-dependent dehydrogenase (short-subunit alcohol dehydrogenase family)